jgi:hypothetical protein
MRKSSRDSSAPTTTADTAILPTGTTLATERASDAPTATPSQAVTIDAAEVGSVVRELARAYQQSVQFQLTEMQRSLPEADAAARRYIGEPFETDADYPADKVSWSRLQRLIDHDPERGWALWERAKAEARNELSAGHRAAGLVERFGDGPWERAQFLAVRHAFTADWRPRGGIEQALIDTLAQTWSEYLRCLDMPSGPERPERLIEAEGWHRLFIRTLRALRDLRRFGGPVVIQGAGQVNLGAQQVNIAGTVSE